MTTATPAESVTTDKAPECLVEKRGHVLIVTMNRPEARNALSTEMMRIMTEAWDQVDKIPTSASRSSPAPAATSARART